MIIIKMVDINSLTFEKEACGAVPKAYHPIGTNERKRVCARFLGHRGRHYTFYWYNWKQSVAERRQFARSGYDFDRSN